MSTRVTPTSDPHLTMAVVTKEGETAPHRIRFLHDIHGWLVQVQLVPVVDKEVMSIDILLRNLDRLSLSEQDRAALDALQRCTLAGVVKRLRIDAALVQPHYETSEEDVHGSSERTAGESHEPGD